MRIRIHVREEQHGKDNDARDDDGSQEFQLAGEVLEELELVEKEPLRPRNIAGLGGACDPLQRRSIVTGDENQ